MKSKNKVWITGINGMVGQALKRSISKSKSYNILESSRKDYIGHIILNYDDKNHIIREAWFKGSKKIRQFLK